MANGTDFATSTIPAVQVSGFKGNTAFGLTDGTAIEPVAFFDDGTVTIDTSGVAGADQITITSPPARPPIPTPTYR